MSTTFAKPDSYPVDGRGVLFSIGYSSAKHLGAGRFYLVTIKARDGEPHTMVESGVFNYSKKPNPASTAKVALAKATFGRIQIGEESIEQAITSGDMKIEGSGRRWASWWVCSTRSRSGSIS